MSATMLTGARFIGQRLPRKEDQRLLTGKGRYVDDVSMPGMLHAAFVRSTVARGTVTMLDTEAAKAAPGVVAVFTAVDFEPLGVKLMNGWPIEGQSQKQIPLLAEGRVFHVGDPVAIVIAESRALAEDGAALVELEVDEEDPVVTISDARGDRLVFEGDENNVAAMMATPENPEITTAFEQAPHVVTTTLKHQRIVHAPMEPRGIVSLPQGPGELTVHIACQNPKTLAQDISEHFGLSQRKVRVLAKDVGGAFGLKSRCWREECAAIAASMLLDRPVKWAEDRLEHMIAANQAREQECTLKTAFDAEGSLLASHCDYALNNGAYPHFPDSNLAAMMFVWGAYKNPHFGFDSRGLHSNTTGLAAYRGPWAIETLIRETQLDIAARQMGMDPVELRRKNLVTAADQPRTTSMGLQLEDITPAECLEKLLEEFDVAAFRAEQEAARKQGRYLGLGICTYVEPTASGQFPPMATEAAHIRIEPDGQVTALMGTHSQGQGTETTMAQLVAETLGVRYEDVTVVEEDSAAGGFGAGSGGSRQAVIGGGAAIGASQRMLEKVKQLTAHLYNASPDAVRLEDGVIHIDGTPEMTHSLAEVAAIAYGHPGRLPEGMDLGLETSFRYNPPPMTFASAAHACTVEVDIDTGFVKILRWICSEDCGVVINPGVVEGQVAGGLAQAIGMVLLEDMVIDERGSPMTVTFKDYLLPQITDVPDFEYTHIHTPAANPGGFRGVGEGGAIIGPPTLINAIHDALSPFGVTCLDLPLKPTKLLALIDAARDAQAA
ncbi:MAG: xanthine dehydrogenase family protein molybdopterin-binding subunit [Novosphingobium sp.]|nr:xanthine dehydrogenase family protein molybdopterin-binding subunit [Novosphingobium sp.]